MVKLILNGANGTQIVLENTASHDEWSMKWHQINSMKRFDFISLKIKWKNNRKTTKFSNLISKKKKNHLITLIENANSLTH